jgi:hypothetical protein
VGLAIIASARISTSAEKTRTNLLLRQPVYTTAFGILVIFVGLTSLFYHVSLTLVGRWLDYLGMYSIVSFTVVYNLARLRILHNRTFVLAYAVLMLCLGIPMVAISSLNVKRLLLLISILGMLALEAIIYWVRRPLHSYPGYLLSAVGILALATGINLLDEYGKICTPNSLWQWHAVWHFLTAVVLGLLYLYFRTADDGRRNPAEI